MMKSLDLLLVNVGGARKRVYQELSEDYSAIEPPFWAALTAGFIRGRGFNVDILDANAENLDAEDSAKRIVEINPALVDIIVYGQHPSASTQLMGSAGRLCGEIKKIDPERKIILTGLHPSALPERTLREDECDFVAQGEGVYTVLNLLQKRKFSEIPGLWRRENGKIIGNPRAKNIENLTLELGGVAWDLLPLGQGKYKAHNWQCLGNLDSRLRYASLSTSLGCPYGCTFCAINATFGGERKIRYWDPKWVLQQIDSLVQKYDTKVIKIIDELFIFNPKHFMPIAEGLIERDYGLNIWAYARVDVTQKILEEKQLEKLKKAGFNWLCIGFEAGSDAVRKDVNKGVFSEEDINTVRKKVENAGINILGNYLFGLPEDDLRSMQKTLDLALALQCEYANFYCTMAYPGSELYKEAVKNGWKLPDSWGGYSQHSYDCQPLPTKHIGAAEVLRFRDKAFKNYFTDPRYLNRIEEKFGLKARNHIENMTKIELKRALLGD